MPEEWVDVKIQFLWWWGRQWQPLAGLYLCLSLQEWNRTASVLFVIFWNLRSFLGHFGSLMVHHMDLPTRLYPISLFKNNSKLYLGSHSIVSEQRRIAFYRSPDLNLQLTSLCRVSRWAEHKDLTMIIWMIWSRN